MGTGFGPQVNLFFYHFLYTGSNSAISRSTRDQIDETEDNKRNKKQIHEMANIAVERSLNEQSNSKSINGAEQDDEVVMQTIGIKPRSLSCDSPMASRCHVSQYTETKRRYTFSTVSESIAMGKEIFTEENMQGGDHRRHKVTIY